jgi:hypothetical protein
MMHSIKIIQFITTLYGGEKNWLMFSFLNIKSYDLQNSGFFSLVKMLLLKDATICEIFQLNN